MNVKVNTRLSRQILHGLYSALTDLPISRTNQSTGIVQMQRVYNARHKSVTSTLNKTFFKKVYYVFYVFLCRDS